MEISFTHHCNEIFNKAIQDYHLKEIMLTRLLATHISTIQLKTDCI